MGGLNRPLSLRHGVGFDPLDLSLSFGDHGARLGLNPTPSFGGFGLKLLTRIEDLLNRLADQSGDLKSQREARIVFARLYGVYGLPRDTQMFGENGL